MKRKFRVTATVWTTYDFTFETDIPDDLSEDDAQDWAYDEAQELAFDIGPRQWECEEFSVEEIK